MAEARATLKDVAAVSGVSPTTVSFVLNETPGQTIPETTRERVLRAARELGYTPHRVARALREGSSRVVVVRVGGLPGGSSLDGFLLGLRGELEQHGHGLALDPADSEIASGEYLDALAPRAVIDLVAQYSDAANEDDGGWADGLAAHTFTQLEHLARRGHTEIAFGLPGESDAAGFAAVRLELARQAAERLGQRMSVLRVGEQRADAERSLRELRGGHPSLTAVAAFDDDVAFRVLAGAVDLGWSVPGDLAVIGFDETRYAALWNPALTTVRIEAEVFGRRAARRVLGLPVGEWEVSPSRVVVRRTT